MSTSNFVDYDERPKAFGSLRLGPDLGFAVNPEMAAKLETQPRTMATTPELGDWAVLDDGIPDSAAEIAAFVRHGTP